MTDETTMTETHAADLAALSDYVRTLADRMGLKDWAFEVREATPEIVRAIDDETDESLEGIFGVTIDPRRRHAVLHVGGSHARLDYAAIAPPELRREWAAFRLIHCHFARAVDEAMLVPTGADRGLRRHRVLNQIDMGIARVAAAWAPCLPLPLVGLTRRAKDAGGKESEQREATR